MAGIKRTKEALGVMVDGKEVLVAHVRLGKAGPVLLGLERGSLVCPLDEGGAAAASRDDGAVEAAPAEPEGPLPALDEEGLVEDREPASNAEAVFRLLRKFPVHRCRLALALSESCVSYGHFDDAEGLRGRRLRKRLIQEALGDGAEDPGGPLQDRLAVVSAGPAARMWVRHEDPLRFLSLTDSLKPFLGKVQVGLIDTLELTLMNVVRAGLPPAEGVTAVVFIGEASSRVVFARDGAIVALSRPIHEGIGSDQVLHTVHRRMLFEQDTGGVPSPSRVVLAGGCGVLGALGFFTERFPDARVELLEPRRVDATRIDLKERDLLSHYAVPIGLAWKALCPKDPRFSTTNFLPKVRRRAQNPLEIAWHGLLLLTAVSAATLLLGIHVRDQSRAIQAKSLSVTLLAQQIEAQQTVAMLVERMRRQAGDYERSFALIDTLAQNRRLWSRELWRVSRAVRETGKVWLRRVTTAEPGEGSRRKGSSSEPATGLVVLGTALTRERTPELAARVGRGELTLVEQSRIRERPVYTFDLRSRVPSGKEL